MFGGCCNELAVDLSVRGCKRSSFGIPELVYVRLTSFLGSNVLGEGGCGNVLVKMSDFSIFCCFSMKPAVSRRVSWALSKVVSARDDVEVIICDVSLSMGVFGEFVWVKM